MVNSSGHARKYQTRDVLLRGRLCTVDLLVLTSLDQHSFIMKILFSSFTKQATLMRRSTVLRLSSGLVFRDQSNLWSLPPKNNDKSATKSAQ